MVDDQTNFAMVLEAISMIILVTTWHVLRKEKVKDIKEISLAMMYFGLVSVSGSVSGGCITIVTLLGPSIFSKTFG